MSSSPESHAGPVDFRAPSSRATVDVGEALRQLDLAEHDIAVASGCVGLGDLDEAHTRVITARAAAEAAEVILRTALQLGTAGSA